MITQKVRQELYRKQILRLDRRLAVLRSKAERWSWIRLIVFISGIIATFVAYFAVGAWLFWLLGFITIIAFGASVFYHRSFLRGITLYDGWRSIKTQHIARIDLEWDQLPVTPFEPEHPLAVDLDLVGERSVHHLLDTCVTYEASSLLRDWLLAAEPNLEAVLSRQALVRELIQLPLFRDKLTLRATLAANQYRRKLKVTPLLKWFQQHTSAQSLQGVLRILGPLALANIILFILASVHLVPAFWIGTFVIYFMWMGMTMRNLEDPFEDAMSVQDGLNQIKAVFTLLESYQYGQHIALRTLCAPFLDPVNCPSRYIHKIERVTWFVSIRGNPLMWMLINSLVPYDLFFADMLRRYKREIVGLLPGWLDVWYELEAVSALATFGYLNPAYTFPKFNLAGEVPIFEASAIGHPLLPTDRKVTNDFSLDAPGAVIIITGSNMAGKSTFLRTLGVNLSLAYAGAPVNAAKLETGLFRLFTCIRVTDSVADGFSYFYAEVRRLKALLNALDASALDADHALPLFFLIDEIFKGTNNQERLIGSRAYIRGLVGRNGLGAISTHDLELVKLATEDNHILNYHFREEVIDGQMVFDYKIHTGPCPTTNALKIMQLEGLPIE